MDICVCVPHVIFIIFRHFYKWNCDLGIKQETFHSFGGQSLGQKQDIGKLIFIFFTVNCLDRHVVKDPSAVAIIWERNEPGEQEKITYKYVRLIFWCCDMFMNVEGFTWKYEYGFCLILGSFLSRPVRQPMC